MWAVPPPLSGCEGMLVCHFHCVFAGALCAGRYRFGCRFLSLIVPAPISGREGLGGGASGVSFRWTMGLETLGFEVLFHCEYWAHHTIFVEGGLWSVVGFR